MFIGVFAVMAVLVVGVTMSVVKQVPRTVSVTAASARTEPAGGAGPAAGAGLAGVSSHGAPLQAALLQGALLQGVQASKPASQRALNTRLTAALRSAAALCPGQLSVAVRDQTTGVEALSLAGQSYPAESTAAADILAVLLYQHQQPGEPLSMVQQASLPLREAQPSGAPAGAPLTRGLAALATRMVQYRSRAATARLWRLIGGARGFEAGAWALRLRHTDVPPSGGWRQVTTTAADQLQLLTDLTSAVSPLTPAARAEEVALMERATAGRRTWAAAAASPGTSFAASSAWHFGLSGSMAIVRRGSQNLVVVVLSQGCASRAAGMAVARAAARAAAALVTAAVPVRITPLAPARASRGRRS